ncbi:MAG: O-antigen ligase family protein [bacterium]|nr:O-antigen ligase family protein [bacterium]
MVTAKTELSALRFSFPLRWWITIIIIECTLAIIVSTIPSLTQPGLVVVGLILGLYFIIALIRPRIALGILAFCFPFYNFVINIVYQSHTYKILLLFPTIFGSLLFLAVLLRFSAKLQQYAAPQVFLLVPIGMLIVWSILSSAWTEKPFSAWYSGLNLLISFMVIYCIFQLIQTESQLFRFYLVVILGGLITAAAIILSTFFSTDRTYIYPLITTDNIQIFESTFFYVMRQGMKRAMGFGTYNQMSLLMTVHLFLAGVLLISQRRWTTKTMLIISMFYMLYAQLLTKTRAPIVGMLLGAFLTIYLLCKRITTWNRKQFWFSMVIMIIFITMLFLSIVSHLEKGLTRFTAAVISDVEVKDSSWTLRMTWWQESIYQFFATYGLGVGAGNVSEYLYQNAPHPHNTYIHLMVELGIFGTIILATLLISIVKNTIYALRRHDLSPELTKTVAIIAGALVADGFALGFEHDYYWIPTWIYLAILLLPINLALKTKEEGK